MEKEQTKPIKPLCLALAEFEAALVKLINTSGIPFYLLEPSLCNAAKEATQLADAERKEARERYRKELAEYENAVKDGEKAE